MKAGVLDREATMGKCVKEEGGATFGWKPYFNQPPVGPGRNGYATRGEEDHNRRGRVERLS
jgi:hypothetical protein